MSDPARNEQLTPRTRRQHRATGRALRLVGGRRISEELQSALDAIPADSVTARTAGALRVARGNCTIMEERVAFEQAVAEENAPRSDE